MAFFEGQMDGRLLTAHGMTFGLMPDELINRKALIARYGNVGRASEVCGGVATVCLTTAGALKVAGVNPDVLKGVVQVNKIGPNVSEPTHIGFDLAGTPGRNLIHYGRHVTEGRHIGILYKEPFKALIHFPP